MLVVTLLLARSSSGEHMVIVFSHVHMNSLAYVAYLWDLRETLAVGTYKVIGC